MRYVALIAGILCSGSLLLAQQNDAYVQIIHTVADLAVVDVYISTDGGTNWNRALDDFRFRQATSFLPLPPNNQDLVLGIAPDNSSGPGDIIIRRNIPSLNPGTYYVAAVAGTTAQDADIYYFDRALTATDGGNEEVKVLLFHGSSDAGKVSYYWAGSNRIQHAYERDGELDYKDYSSDYLRLEGARTVVLGSATDVNEIRPLGYSLPSRQDNAFWENQSAGVIFASGLVNTNDEGNRFGLHIALPNGTVKPLNPIEVRRIQIIHNAADPALRQVNIHLGNFPSSQRIQLDFRKALPAIFWLGPSDPLNLFLSDRGDNTQLAQTTLNIPPAGQNTAIFAQGVLDPAQFRQNPNGRQIDFEVRTVTGVKGATSAGSMAIIPFHGVTDAPTVDLEVVQVGTFIGLSYGGHGPAAVDIPANTAARIIIRADNNVVAEFELSQGQARDRQGAIIFASGFLDPANNQDGPEFGLYIAYPTGEVNPISLLNMIQTPVSQIGASTFPALEDSWTISVSAGAAATLPYRLVSLTGQVLTEGQWQVPGAGSWVYTLPAQGYSQGIYLLQVGGQSFRLMK